jgi:hypothetical protein
MGLVGRQPQSLENREAIYEIIARHWSFKPDTDRSPDELGRAANSGGFFFSLPALLIGTGITPTV